MNILIIPEDFRNDQYLLEPIFSNLARALGRPNAKVKVCRDPLLGGVAEALKRDRLSKIFERYDGMTDVFILCVDRDGVEGRRSALDSLEAYFGKDRKFISGNAWEEIETWALAALNLPADWRWSDVRAHINVKEAYFEKFAKLRNVADGPGGGRKALGIEAGRRVDLIRLKCPEDFEALARRLDEKMSG